MAVSGSERLRLARESLEGLALGDAFGDRFFIDREEAERKISERELPAHPWRFSDDTIMACAVYEVLHDHQEIQQKQLAILLAQNFDKDPTRGYGGGAQRVLRRILRDGDWFKHSVSLFQGTGSYGNGAAMRIAPLGAFFFDDLDAVKQQASKSAFVTHAHKEGRAGAIAIALAAAHACRSRGDLEGFRRGLFDVCLEGTPAGAVRDGIELAARTPESTPLPVVVEKLGNGREVSAQDTVPFTLWVAHRHSNDLKEALWTAVSAFGDRDTTAAIIGGVLGALLGPEGLPRDWVSKREGITDWIPA